MQDAHSEYYERDRLARKILSTGSPAEALESLKDTVRAAQARAQSDHVAAPETLQDLDRETYGFESLKTSTTAQPAAKIAMGLGIQVDQKPIDFAPALEALKKATEGWPKGHEQSPNSGNPKDAMGALKASTLSVIPASSILALGGVMALGARKYGRFNWRQKDVKASVYIDAAMRHLMSYTDGETVDPESGEPHIAHVMACMCILVDAQARGCMIDDRDVTAYDLSSVQTQLAGTAAEIIRQTTQTKH